MEENNYKNQILYESKLSHRYFLSPTNSIIVGIIFLLFSSTFFIIAAKEEVPLVAKLFYGMFSLIGVILLVIGIIRAVKEKNAKFKIEINYTVISPGGAIKGKIIPTGKRKFFNKPARLFLVLQKPVFSQFRKKRLLYEKRFFSLELESNPVNYTTHTEYEFEFTLPESFIPHEKWEKDSELIILFNQNEIGTRSFALMKQEKEIRGYTQIEGNKNFTGENIKSSLDVYSTGAYQNKTLNIIITLVTVLISLVIWYAFTFLNTKLPFSFDKAIYLLLIHGFWGAVLFGIPLLGGSIYVIKSFKRNENKKAYIILALVGLYFLSIWPVAIYLDLTGKMDMALKFLERYNITVAIFPAFLFWLLLYTFIKYIFKILRGEKIEIEQIK